MRRRIFITGIGTVSGFGLGAESLWKGLEEGRSAIRPVSLFDASGFSSRLGAEVADFSGAKDFVPKGYRKAVKVMSRDTELAVVAAQLAVSDAGLQTRGTIPEGSGDQATYAPGRMGCQIGAGLISADTAELTLALATARTGPAERPEVDLKAWGTVNGGAGAMNNLPPLWLLKYLPNMLACHVTIIHGAEGPSNTITCAEASALLSIGESTRVIERGDADACFSGGAESKMDLMGLMRMQLLGRLAKVDAAADPGSIVRPFDPQSPGTIMGEGGGILILEEEGPARGRGAKVYAEIAGFGASHSDAMAFATGQFDPRDPGTDDGIQYAIENALGDAGLGPADIDAIVPQADGVPYHDARELGALSEVLGHRLRDIPMVTLSPALGDTSAARGALATAVAALCLSKQRLPARIHGGKPRSDAQAGACPARGAALRHILVLNSSLGGQNAALILRAVPAG